MSFDASELRRVLNRHGGVSSIEQGGKLWGLIRDAAHSSLYFFNKYIWSGHAPKDNLLRFKTHGAMCAIAQDFSIKRYLIEWPRRHMKTTCVTEGYPPWRLWATAFENNDPSQRFFFMAHNKSTASRPWNAIRAGFDRTKFKFFCPEIKCPPRDGYKREGERKPFQWNGDGGEILRDRRTAENTFTPIAQQVVGPHMDEGIIDDLINAENYRTEGAVAKAVDMYRYSTNLLEDFYVSRLGVVGNSWSPGDLNAHIHREALIKGFTVLSISSETGPNLDGENICVNVPEPVMEMLREMPTPIWPERFDEDALAAMRRELGPRIYSAQYLNAPDDPEATLIDYTLVQDCELTLTSDGPAIKLIYGNDVADTYPLSTCNLYVTWDPALGRSKRLSDAKKSDNAIVVTFVTPDGHTGILEEHAHVEDPWHSLERFVQVCVKYKDYIRAGALEEVLFSVAFKKPLRDALAKLEKTIGKIPIRKLKMPRGLGKDQRIAGYLSTYINQRNFFIETSCAKARKQIRTLGIEGAKKDVIDAVGMGTQLWKRPPRVDEIRAERRERRADEAATNRGLTGYGQMVGSGRM